MTDERILELCRKALGWKHLGAVGVVLQPGEKYIRDVDEKYKGQRWCMSGGNDWWDDPRGHWVCGHCESLPNPLHDDADAMRLLKRFPVTCVDALDCLRWALGNRRREASPPAPGTEADAHEST
jgi:hypothetical protein